MDSPLRKILKQIPTIEHHRFGVIAYVLNSEIYKDGQIDNLKGMIFFLGSFSTLELAKSHVKKIIDETGYNGIIICKYASAVPLVSKFESVSMIDPEEKALAIDDANIKRIKEVIDKRRILEEELARETERTYDIANEEFAQYNFIQYMNNKKKLQFLKEEISKTEANLSNYKDKIEKYQQIHGNDDKWMINLKQKLKDRGESSLLE